MSTTFCFRPLKHRPENDFFYGKILFFFFYLPIISRLTKFSSSKAGPIAFMVFWHLYIVSSWIVFVQSASDSSVGGMKI